MVPVIAYTLTMIDDLIKTPKGPICRYFCSKGNDVIQNKSNNYPIEFNHKKMAVNVSRLRSTFMVNLACSCPI